VAVEIPAVSLFCGIGGLDLGAKLAGYCIRAAVDCDRDTLALYSAVHGTTTFACHVADIDPHEVIEAANLHSEPNIVLIAGPPCTGYSHAGFWIERKRLANDSQVGRLFDCHLFLKILRPIAFVLENVPGLLFRNYRPLLDRFLSMCEDLGYRVTVLTLNSADYGVPQSRRRVFLVGLRDQETYLPPDPRFATNHRTSEWAIGQLSSEGNPPEPDEVLVGKYAHLLPLVPPGDNYLYFTARRGHPAPLFKWRSRYWSFLQKLHPQKPSPTIPAQRVSNNGPFHWENRRLRIREVSRLQGFPDNYPIGVVPQARRRLGNAVPPLLGAQVLWKLAVQLHFADESGYPEHLEVALAPNAPAQAVSDVVGQYVV
jgi:DNA (cytosine-5)-methyltransferase 1